MSQYTTGSARGTGGVEGGPLTAVAGMALLINLAGLYAYTGVAVCVFGYMALTLFLSSRAWNSVRNAGSAEAGNVALFLSWLAALVGGVLVGAFHWTPFAQAAYVVLAAYALASLIWLIGRAFSGFWSWLFPAVGAALLMAVLRLGSPPGADDMEKKESWTPVTVTAVDPAGQPIEGATVYLDLVPVWRGDPPLDGDRKWWSKDTTESDGAARMALHEDPRFQRLVIRVRHPPFAGGYNEPDTIGGTVGHTDARLEAWLPEAKAPYSFEVMMSQRAHPDSAYLAISLETPVSAESVMSRSLKLALSAQQDFPWHENQRGFDEAAVAQQGMLRDVYLSGSQRLVFRLGPDLTARPLTLHVLEREWFHGDETYQVLQQIRIDPIPLGGDVVLPLLHLPARHSSPNPVAEGSPAAERR